MIAKNFILGIGVSNATIKEVLEFLLKGLQKRTKKIHVVTPNPEIIVRACHDNKFKRILNNASLALPDGTGVFWAGKILGKNFKERITGVDILENLCKMASDYGFRVGFLGGGAKIAERTAECLKRKYPGLKVGFVASELKSPRLLKPPLDILFVAFGAPKQEFWISKHLEKLPVKVAMGVGGVFDYLGGQVPRAPKWIRSLGFEWLFRLVVQPWRIKRQLALLEFIYLLLKEKLSSTLSNFEGLILFSKQS